MTRIDYCRSDISIGRGVGIQGIIPVINDDEFSIRSLNHPWIPYVFGAFFPTSQCNFIAPGPSVIFTKSEMDPRSKFTPKYIGQGQSPIIHLHQCRRRSAMAWSF